jgi:hypothetical protein
MTLPVDIRPQVKGSRTPIDASVVQGIRQASQATHVDFGYLMAQAQQESGFHTDAKATNGSATGLYQFIESTWLTMVHQHGAEHGVGDLAQQISVDSSGRPTVANPDVKAQILALRNDPKLSAAFAGELAHDNKVEVEQATGRKAGNAELSLAHFLGAGGATELLKAIQKNGATPAASLLPDAAAANHSVFFNAQTGEPRTVAELYRTFADRMDKNSAAFGPIGASGTASSDTTSVAMASSLDRSKDTLPFSAVFNSLLLTAMKLIGGGTGAATTDTSGTTSSSLTAPTDPDRPHQRKVTQGV